MEIIKLSPKTQKKLFLMYKKQHNLTWIALAEKFGYKRYSLKNRLNKNRSYLSKEIFSELITLFPQTERKEIERNPSILELKLKRFPNIKKGKSVARKVRERYGNDYFQKIGHKGGKNQKYSWTKEKLLNQGIFGKYGGIKRIQNKKLLDKKEILIAKKNKKLGLSFKPNYFLNDELNFDFVYFNEKNIVCVEEITFDPLRGLSSFIEKRNALDSKIPFILSYEKSRPEVLLFLLENNIIPIELNRRENLITNLIENEIARDSIKNSIKEEVVMLLNDVKIFSNLSVKSNLAAPFDKYEELVHKALQRINLNPIGKTVIETKNDLHFVPDNMFVRNNENIAVLVSFCKSRGSLLYTFYNHSSLSLLMSKISKIPIKTFSIIFDFSGTLTSQGCSKPRELWLKYCDYKLVINKENLNKIDELIKSSLGL